jgi:hypothetical protein
MTRKSVPRTARTLSGGFLTTVWHGRCINFRLAPPQYGEDSGDCVLRETAASPPCHFIWEKS